MGESLKGDHKTLSDNGDEEVDGDALKGDGETPTCAAYAVNGDGKALMCSEDALKGNEVAL